MRLTDPTIKACMSVVPCLAHSVLSISRIPTRSSPLIPPSLLIIPDQRRPDLTRIADPLRSTFLGPPLLLRIYNLLSQLRLFLPRFLIRKMSLHLLSHPLGDLRLLISPGKFRWGGRDVPGVIFDLALVGCSDGGEEIGDVRPGIAFESHVLEVPFRFGSRTVVDDLTFGDDRYFVEEVVNPVTGLVQADYRGVSLDVGVGAHDFSVVQCGVGVETASGVIPALD